MNDVVNTMDRSQTSAPPEYAGLPQTSTVQASPRGVRGKPLTANEELVLVALCKARNQEGHFADKPKRFWIEISQIFHITTHRPYSWQSCRRRMIKAEVEENSQQSGAQSASPSLNPPIQAEPTETAPVPESISVEGDNDLDGDDDDLPPGLPFVRGNITSPHGRWDAEKNAFILNLVTYFNDTVGSFENQLQAVMDRLIKDEDDQRNIDEAFSNFKQILDLALEKAGYGQKEEQDQ
jgi:hypothetical protein